jgi:hypothetical protein
VLGSTESIPFGQPGGLLSLKCAKNSVRYRKEKQRDRRTEEQKCRGREMQADKRNRKIRDAGKKFRIAKKIQPGGSLSP